MELGNAVFGNSRGECGINRDRFGDLFCNLMERYGMYYGDNGIRTIVTDTFEVRPYYWGDCTCDGEKADEEWAGKNEHEPKCYITELAELEKTKEEERSLTVEEARPLLKKHNLPEQGWGVHCDCSYEKKWEAFLESRGGYHRSNCECVLPNFLYKPDNLEINWYKYPLRDSYSNRLFDEQELKDIFAKIGYQKEEKK